jgi:RHS repeat-associated protein
MTNDGLNALVYDAENRVVRVNGSEPTYVYDGAGLRVKKCAPHCTNPTSTTVYVFSGSKVIAEYDNGAAVESPTREYVYSGGALVATHEGGSLKFHYSDHLSARITSDSAGGNGTEQGHYPFGEQRYNGSASKWLFTSYERDSESANDFAVFRYDVVRFGRFNAPDPLAGSLAVPQSLNRYAYVLSDVVNSVDPLGLQHRRIEPFMQPNTDQRTCVVDGLEQKCGSVSFSAAVQCPSNNCGGIKAQVGPAGSVEFYRRTHTRELVLECRGASFIQSLVPMDKLESTVRPERKPDVVRRRQ